MSAVVLVHGTVRVVKPATRKADGARYGRHVSVLTEVPLPSGGPVLGETMEVTVFDARQGEPDVRAEVGDHVVWAVEVEGSSYGVRGRYRAEGGAVAALPASSWSADPEIAQPA